MNKEEIQKELERAYIAERTIKDNIIKLLEQLVVAEKPKLRHGDFGNSHAKIPFIVLNKDVQWLESKVCGVSGLPSSDFTDYVLFNLVDLLKEWSEPLEEFDFDVHNYKIDPKQGYAPIKVAGTWHTLAEAEEIWHKLGRLIMTLKKKNPQK